jgi:dihydrofolate synthase/folylpolyglutamate synthase
MAFLPHWPIPYGHKPIMFGLERVLALLEKLGNPHKKLPPVIHITGTNGKGSTLAYLKYIFEDADYKVHRYISPHLINFNERICLAGEDISDDFLYEIMEETRIAAGDIIETTFFEAITAAAFLAFSKVPADVLLLEVGMGGRLDATNVIDDPILSIITTISYDHTEYLGKELSQIAYEKAGIIKPNCPTVIGWQTQEAFNVLEKKCSEVNSPFYACKHHWDLEPTNNGFNFMDFELNKNVPFPKPNLFGIHQYLNAAVAVASAYCLQDFKLTYNNIANGISKAFWPARMQRINNGVLYNLLPDKWELWLDGAHNNNGAEMVAATAKSEWNDGKPLVIINGRTGDRDIKTFLSFFQDIASFICGVKVRTEPKGESAENIANGAKEMGFEAYACDSLIDAIALIKSKFSTPVRILICGSLYLAGDVLLANKQI